jgi:hypothetical protein
VPLAPIERVVDEGVLIAKSAVRMAVKNELIVGALRDQREYDAEAVARLAGEQLMKLAAENDETADRLERARTTGQPVAPMPRGAPNQIDRLRDEDHRRRPSVHRRLAEALRELAGDREAVDELVNIARIDGAQEVWGEVVRRLRARDFAADPDYAATRNQRVQLFLRIDLANLRHASQGRE